MSGLLTLGPGVVLPIAHVVVDDDGIRNLRNALGLTPQLPDPNAGEMAGEYAVRTGTTLSAELPADHRYDPWATAPDGSPGWWIGPFDSFNCPPGFAQPGYIDPGLSPIVVGKALESTGYLGSVQNGMLFLDHVCAAAAASGAKVFGYIVTGQLEGLPSLDFMADICHEAWVAYSGGDVGVPAMSEEEVAAFHTALLELIGGEPATLALGDVGSHPGDVGDALPPEAGAPVTPPPGDDIPW